jgi:hypothetical protein
MPAFLESLVSAPVRLSIFPILRKTVVIPGAKREILDVEPEAADKTEVPAVEIIGIQVSAAL